MWRWVTRGLVLALLSALSAPALLAQAQFIGELDLPDPAAVQSGVILVRGFALDPAQISKIELYVDDQFQYRAITGLPRIDIEQAYPNYPGIHETAPGFTTGFLAGRFSNGPHTVFVRVYLSDGSIIELGRRTITIDNTLNQTPFGSLDQPGGDAIFTTSGSFPVVGWAADTDGVARIDVLIDGGNLQAAMYGDARPDVGATFPDFPEALFSGFIGNVDTTRVQDGVHLLEVRAVDRLGASRLIGRRQIQVSNSEQNLKPFGVIDTPQRDAVLFGSGCGAQGQPPVFSPFVRPTALITPVSGWVLDLGARVDLGRVSYVELLVDGIRFISTDDCTLPFGGFANCYGVPRFDVARFYPNYPDAPRSGYIFTLDVGNLLNLGVREGLHTLKIRAGDLQQTVAEIPGPQGIPVFFKCADTNQESPSIGFIDIPDSFDYVTGTVVFQGWALDLSSVAAVELIIDGNLVGVAQYGFPRPDVQAQNPQFPGSLNSGWQFSMDTTKLSNARHRLTARVLNGRGNRNEIGSVDFYVLNSTPTP
ncbi:MAG TPA: Ig-like domain-containing protein [Thermoanaerobaculia bacterium]